jgi:small-conductance mechanosensitive channel
MMEKVQLAFQDLLDSVIAVAPKIVVGILLVIVALIFAKAVQWMLQRILTRLKFDDLVARVGVDKTLQKIGIRQQLNVFLPRIVYVLLLFMLAKTGADALELTALSGAMGTFFAYLPNLIAAILLVIIGTAAGQFAGQTVETAAAESGIEFAPALGRMVTALIVFIVGMMAIGQLKIDTEIIRVVTAALLAGGALGFGLSFGLGTRDLTRNIVAGFYAKKILTVGKEVKIGDHSGVLEAITPTHVILAREDRTITIANEKFLDTVAEQ